MGAWGVFSEANDSTHDVLDKFFDNSNKMTQEQANSCLMRIYTNKMGSYMDEDDYRLVKLGCVVFVLLEGLKVIKSTLRMALALADEQLLPDKLLGWTKGDSREIGRQEAVEAEKLMIEEALARDGKALKRTLKMIAEKRSGKKKTPKDTGLKDLLGKPIYKDSNVLWFKSNSKEPPAIKGKVTKVTSKLRGNTTINTLTIDLGYRTTKVNNLSRLVVIDKLL